MVAVKGGQHLRAGFGFWSPEQISDQIGSLSECHLSDRFDDGEPYWQARIRELLLKMGNHLGISPGGKRSLPAELPERERRFAPDSLVGIAEKLKERVESFCLLDS